MAVVASSGVAGATVTALSARAGVSRSTFYESFESSTQCLLAAHRQAIERLTESISAAFAAEHAWHEGVVAGLAALVAFLDAEPELARVLLVEALAMGEAALEQRREALRMLRDLLDDAGPPQTTEDNHVHPLRAEAAIGAVAEVVRGRATEKQPSPYTPLLAELVEVVLVQYEAPREQRQKAKRRAEAIMKEHSARPPSPPRVPARPAAASPFNERAFRMETCVAYLAANPGASNAEVANGIGVPHLGQVSRLLARLLEQGLLAKRTGEPGRQPNAWRLTPEGERCAQALQERLL